jgi:hypothetical protein
MGRGLMLGLALVGGTVLGAGGMLVAFPFLFPPPVVAERAPDAAGAGASGDVQRVGRFRFDEAAPGRDPIHWANGTGGVYRSGDMTIVRFDDSFETGPGPAYWVYLNTVWVGEEEAFRQDSRRLKVAPLKSFTGGQNYPLPPGVDIAGYRTVTVWCEAFGVYIGSAPLPAP